MGSYRAKTKAAVAAFEDGVFEREFTATEEQDWLASGALELVPRKYRICSHNYEAGKQGDEVELALLVEIESALLGGGHLERVEDEDEPESGEPELPAKESTRKKG